MACYLYFYLFRTSLFFSFQRFSLVCLWNEYFWSHILWTLFTWSEQDIQIRKGIKNRNDETYWNPLSICFVISIFYGSVLLLLSFLYAWASKFDMSCVHIYIHIYIFLYLSIYLYILSIYISKYSIYLSIYLSINIHPYIYVWHACIYMYYMQRRCYFKLYLYFGTPPGNSNPRSDTLHILG